MILANPQFAPVIMMCLWDYLGLLEQSSVFLCLLILSIPGEGNENLLGIAVHLIYIQAYPQSGCTSEILAAPLLSSPFSSRLLIMMSIAWSEPFVNSKFSAETLE